MKLSSPFTILSVALFFLASADASCPCFSADQIGGDVHRFVDGSHTNSPSYTSTSYQLYTTTFTRYVTADSTTRYLERGRLVELQAYTCTDEKVRDPDYSLIVDFNRDHRVINRQQYFACRDIIRHAAIFTTPSSDSELQAFEENFNARPITLQNVGTSKFLQRQSDGSIRTVSGGQTNDLANQWTLEEDECPRNANSAAKDTTRTCFRLQSYSHPNDTILSTNGGVALREAPPAHILGVYILEPTLCYRTMESCTVRVKVAYYSNLNVADLWEVNHNGSPTTPLRLAVGDERELDEAEWNIALCMI